jgi:hypothetical protein
LHGIYPHRAKVELLSLQTSEYGWVDPEIVDPAVKGVVFIASAATN